MPAYALLQEDNTQTSAELLSRISFQLSSFTVSPTSINSTAIRNDVPPSFQPTAAARAINILWFLSLLLSLSSALLGILAKQWIREYLKWDTATAPPKENVLIRQIRFEAWDDWHTPAIISAIPAFLELAVVMFVCGLAVFLWTLDTVVAIAITIGVAIFLLVVSTLTVLPVLFKRCPYKSPTAWACVILGTAVQDTAFFLKNLASVHLRAWTDYCRAQQRALIDVVWDVRYGYRAASQDFRKRRSRILLGWRLRDREGGVVRKLLDAHGKVSNAPIVVVEELKMELTYPHRDPRACDLYWANYTPEGEDIVKRVSETNFLFQALLWVGTASQDPLVNRQVSRCFDSIYTPSVSSTLPPEEASATAVVESGIRNMALWYIFSRGHAAVADTWPSLLRTPNLKAPAQGDESTVAFFLQTLFRLRPAYPANDQRHIIIPMPASGHHPLTRFSTAAQARMLGWLCTSSVKSLVQDLLSPSILSAAGHYNTRLGDIYCRRFVEVLSVLPSVCWLEHTELRNDCAFLENLLDAYNSCSTHPAVAVLDRSAPGLRSALLEVLSRHTLLALSDSDKRVITVGACPQYAMSKQSVDP